MEEDGLSSDSIKLTAFTISGSSSWDYPPAGHCTLQTPQWEESALVSAHSPVAGSPCVVWQYVWPSGQEYAQKPSSHQVVISSRRRTVGLLWPIGGWIWVQVWSSCSRLLPHSIQAVNPPTPYPIAIQLRQQRMSGQVSMSRGARRHTCGAEAGHATKAAVVDITGDGGTAGVRPLAVGLVGRAPTASLGGRAGAQEWGVDASCAAGRDGVVNGLRLEVAGEHRVDEQACGVCRQARGGRCLQAGIGHLPGSGVQRCGRFKVAAGGCWGLTIRLRSLCCEVAAACRSPLRGGGCTCRHGGGGVARG